MKYKSDTSDLIKYIMNWKFRHELFYKDNNIHWHKTDTYKVQSKFYAQNSN